MSLVRRILSSNIGLLVLELILILIPVFVLTNLLNLLPTAFQQSTSGDLVLNMLAAIIIVIVFALEMHKLEHRSLADVGFARQQWLRQTVLGFTLGGALMTVVILVLTITGAYHITGADGFAIVECVFLTIALALLTLLFTRSSKIGFFHYVLFILLLVGFISTSVTMLILIGGAVQEELIFRGLIFRRLERSFGSWIALGVSAILFGFAHLLNPNGSLIGALGIAITGGILSAIIYILTRSLWWAIGVHLGWNYFEGPFFGAQLSGHSLSGGVFSSTLTGPVVWSGGSFGPEAGLASIILISAFGFYLCYRASRQNLMLSRNQPPSIPEERQRA
ncbi:CPBP family intramembrane glutamic endopeptidase [Dictyobacter arantiisoli]|uniref:CAAX amino protease n=1 Tax=Dictyobacter arantiisoli TaxID=2014874 RepID=A0A5A5TH61_9CHLR|nr:CPBP family intramembrane glutamic endopeptidase [Dictyobacter arantiisoli]GCF10707.1 CAAX amino protease [Dictyobacter arantiisoli]